MPNMQVISRRSTSWKPLTSLVLAGMLAVTQKVHAAESIQFPEEELASESVLPVFDQPTTVRNKNILLAKRFELGFTGGLSLLEPFYNPYSLGVMAGYHFTEEHGLDLLGLYFMQGLSSNGSGLNPIPNTTTNANLQYAPAPQYMLLANYQYTGFYGKISMAKDFVMHLNVYGEAGGGIITVGDGQFPILGLGLGQKFFFSNKFSLKLDFRFMAYQGPDVLSRPLSGVSTNQPASSFSSKTVYLSLLNIGAAYTF